MIIYISDNKLVLTKICMALDKIYNQAAFQHHGDFIVFYVDQRDICLKLDTVKHTVFDWFFNDGVKLYVNVMATAFDPSKFAENNMPVTIINAFESTKQGQRNFMLFDKANNLSRYSCKRLWINSSHDAIGELLSNLVASKQYDYLGVGLIAEEVVDCYCIKLTSEYNRFKLDSKQSYIINELTKSLLSDEKELIHYHRIKVSFNHFVKGFLKTLDDKEKFDSIEECEELIEKLEGGNVKVTACKYKAKYVEPMPLLNQFDIVDMFVNKHSKEEVLKILSQLFKLGLISNPITNERSLPNDMTFRQYIETVSILLNSKFSIYKPYIKSKSISSTIFNQYKGNSGDKTYGIIPNGDSSMMDIEMTKEEATFYEAICTRYLGIVAGEYKSYTYNIKAEIIDHGTINTSAEIVLSYGHEIFDLAKLEASDIKHLIEVESKRKHLNPLKVIKVNSQIDDLSAVNCSTKSSRGLSVKKILKTLENCSDKSRVSIQEKVMHKDLSIGSVESRVKSLNELIQYNLLEETGDGLIVMKQSVNSQFKEAIIPSTEAIKSIYREIYKLFKKEISLSDCLTVGCELIAKDMYYQNITKQKKEINYTVIVEDNRCPVCNGPLINQKNFIMCQSCRLKVFKVIKGVVLSEQHIMNLLTQKETKTISGFHFKNNKNGRGKLVINTEEKRVGFKFD